MNITQTKIIIIHDDLLVTSPLVVQLKMQHGEEDVLLFRHSHEGLNYVLNNLGQKMVVLLDKNFYDGKEMSGLEVFKEIRKKTSLVYVILTTVSRINEMAENDLKTLINNDLFAFEPFNSDYREIIVLIDDAIQKLEVRVDAVLEDWILQQDHEKRSKPYLKTQDGKVYTLNEILDSIRHQTDIGKQMEKNILKLAVNLLTRQKTRLDD